MATKKAKTPEPAEPSRSKNLRITASPGKTHDRLLAEIAADGLATGACLLVDFGKGAYGELSLADAVRVIDDTAKAVHGGNLKGAETMLTAQAVALNAIFGELARRSAMNMGGYIGAAETYLRLALKAQGQCRATLETLAAIKNPPTVFARQANINNGGQLQVNNGMAPAISERPVPAVKLESRQTGPLGASDGQWMDTRAAGTAGSADPHLAPMGAIDRADDR